MCGFGGYDKGVTRIELERCALGFHGQHALQDNYDFLGIVVMRFITMARAISLVDHRYFFGAERWCRKRGR